MTRRHRIRTARLSVLLLALALGACGTHESPQSLRVDTIIENVTVIDAAEGVRANMDVALHDGKIARVSAHGAHTLPDTVTRIEATGKYLIPGLWDAHVHLTYTEGLDHTTFFPLAIAHGVTSLRDTGGHLDKLAPARAAAKTDPLAPDLYISGPLIDGALRVYAGQSPFNPDISVGAATAADAERIVDELAAAGVDFVKAYEMLSEDAFKALAARADSHGLPVAAHVPLSMTAGDAARAGADDMQHLRNLEFSCASDIATLLAERLDMLAENDADHPGLLRQNIHAAQRPVTIADLQPEACNEIIATLAEHKVFQTPTLTVSRFATHGMYSDETYTASFDYVPEEVGNGWKERHLRYADPSTDEIILQFDDWFQSMLPRLAEAGVPILAGTDAPIVFLTPGASLHQELFLLVEAGLTPLQALEAATSAPATFFGIENETGSIRAGLTADLVLLTADPLEDIRNIAKIEMVIKDGELITRRTLDALLLAPNAQAD